MRGIRYSDDGTRTLYSPVLALILLQSEGSTKETKFSHQMHRASKINVITENTTACPYDETRIRNRVRLKIY